MNRVNSAHLNNNHSEWIRGLDFYKIELNTLRNTLTEIAGKNTGKEMLSEIEHFENIFTVHTDNIERLNRDIHANINQISKELQNGDAGFINSKLLLIHDELGNRYEAEEKAVKETISSFRSFASKWM